MRDRSAPIGACGRAELLWVLRAGGAALLERTGALLGYEERPPVLESKPDVPDAGAEKAFIQRPPPTPEPPEIAPSPVMDALFWRLEGYEPVVREATESVPAVVTAPLGWSHRPSARPAMHALAPWPELRQRLRPALAELREGPEPDLEKLVGRIGRGLLLERIPRRRQRRLGPSVQLIMDRSERLVPYWTDQDQVVGELARLLATEALTRAVFHEGLAEPRLLDRADAVYRPPAAGGMVLVLGDLGSLAAADATDSWLRLGRRIAAAGGRPVALVPCRRSRVPEALRRVWRIVPWERPPGVSVLAGGVHWGEPADSLAARRARTRRLLSLLAPAVRIEPGLLRAVRLGLAEPVLDAAAESDVWQDPAVVSTHSEAATLNPRRIADLRAAFAAEPDTDQRMALALLRVWRGHLPEEIWFEEILNLRNLQDLDPDARADLLDPQDLEDARRFFGHLCTELTPDPDVNTAAGAWVRRMSARATDIWRDEVVGKPLLCLDWALHRHRPDYRPPVPIDPAALPMTDAPVCRIGLCQRGGALSFTALAAARSVPGSPLAIIETRNRLITVQARADTAGGAAFWEEGEPPPWADDWGWDDFGAWVEFSVEGTDGLRVTQRMRWIEPGSFLMGSPAGETERWSAEGPQHEVTIDQGYWLFETACTQALWQAVTGDNPRHFKGPDRPVEQVSWDDAQRFIAALNQRLPGLHLGLPSEAQWEYACRAGTDTPFSFGVNITPEQVNYHGEYPYAGGEKGLYRGETVPVASLPANALGLYEMHGNVREWVYDTWHGNYEGAPADGSAWEFDETGADRVIRGGSWNLGARPCRSAFRRRNDPGTRYDSLGFRCARVQDREPGEPGEGVERASLARPGPRSGKGRAATGSSRAAGGELTTSPEFRLDTAASTTIPLPQTHAIQILTDREHLTLHQTAKPAWASAIGRDRFGLWAEIAIEPKAVESGARRQRWWSRKTAPTKSPIIVGEPVIQRLRWITPGRFLMGSPQDEPGRWEGESPQHQVTFTQGYWLFDSPCTQALWEALVGENPSRFKNPERPVEGVSWDDVQQRFLPALNERIPGFGLPSEAQWEHACRAGTSTALYTGPIEIFGANNAPALDPIAWYGGNSGVDYDLAEGHETTGELWKEMQYETKRAGTRKVKGKQPNPWGLYDMLGNVLEWVQDPWHDNYHGAPTDGSVWEISEAGADRVIRGGSWFNGARYCRSAYRSRGVPGDRNFYLGFRCARVQES